MNRVHIFLIILINQSIIIEVYSATRHYCRLHERFLEVMVGWLSIEHRDPVDFVG